MPKRENGKIVYDVVVPANSIATVIVPASAKASATEGGKAIEGSYETKTLADGNLAVQIDSGDYSFAYLEC